MDYLDPYRRHLDSCPNKARGRDFALCNCPIWVYGRLGGEPYRRSIQTAEWNHAQRRIELLLNSPQDPGSILPAANPRAVATAMKAYLTDCRKRNLADSTLKSYGDVLDDFVDIAGTRDVTRVNLDLLTAFRDQREVKPRTQKKEIEYLRAWCAFCLARGWMTGNPAKLLKPGDRR